MRLNAQVASRLNQLRDTNLRPKYPVDLRSVELEAADLALIRVADEQFYRAVDADQDEPDRLTAWQIVNP
jgi:hypothetical protein